MLNILAVGEFWLTMLFGISFSPVRSLESLLHLNGFNGASIKIPISFLFKHNDSKCLQIISHSSLEYT